MENANTKLKIPITAGFRPCSAALHGRVIQCSSIDTTPLISNRPYSASSVGRSCSSNRIIKRYEEYNTNCIKNINNKVNFSEKHSLIRPNSVSSQDSNSLNVVNKKGGCGDVEYLSLPYSLSYTLNPKKDPIIIHSVSCHCDNISTSSFSPSSNSKLYNENVLDSNSRCYQQIMDNCMPHRICIPRRIEDDLDNQKQNLNEEKDLRKSYSSFSSISKQESRKRPATAATTRNEISNISNNGDEYNSLNEKKKIDQIQNHISCLYSKNFEKTSFSSINSCNTIGKSSKRSDSISNNDNATCLSVLINCSKDDINRNNDEKFIVGTKEISTNRSKIIEELIFKDERKQISKEKKK